MTEGRCNICSARAVVSVELRTEKEGDPPKFWRACSNIEHIRELVRRDESTDAACDLACARGQCSTPERHVTGTVLDGVRS